MKIRTNATLFNAVEHMLQGLAYWLGYRWECYAGHCVMEGVAIDTAVGILNCHIDHSLYCIKQEYGYNNINSGAPHKKLDVAIIEKTTGSCICAIEFKLSTDSNGGIYSDIKKLNLLPASMFRLAILISQKETKTTSSLIDVNGKDVRKLPNCKNARVIRATKAKETDGQTKRVFRVICVEVQ